MADNLTLNAGSGGATLRTLEDNSSIQWPVSVVCYATTVGTPDVLQVVTTAAGLPVAQQGTWSVAATQSGTWNVGTVATITNAVTVQDGGGSLTVDNAGTFAVQASQSGTWAVRNQDGTGNALTSRTTGGSQPLEVAILDGSGNQITSFGGSGGTASNFGSAVPSTGTAAGYSDGTNMQLARVFDLDSGAGTQYVAGVGIRLSGSGGSVEGGTASNPIRTDPTGTTTQPVSGTVTANIGTSGSLALDATLTGGSQKTKLVDTGGTNVASVSAGGALKVDGSAVTQPVSGTFWQATQPVSGTVTANAGTGSFTVTQATASNLKVDISGTAANATAIKVDGSAVTQPVSGTVTANAGSGTMAVSLSSLPALAAGTNLIGKVSASNETATIYNGTTALTPKFAIITASSSGATTVVAAVTSKKIRVLRWRVSANGAANVKWQSHVTPTDISGLSYGTQYKDCGGGYCPVGHFETVAGEALDINLSAAVAVSGELTYVEV